MFRHERKERTWTVNKRTNLGKSKNIETCFGSDYFNSIHKDTGFITVIFCVNATTLCERNKQWFFLSTNRHNQRNVVQDLEKQISELVNRVCVYFYIYCNVRKLKFECQIDSQNKH